MKKFTRAAAIAATATIALSGATGTANAQSGDSSLPGGVSPGSVMDWIGNNTPLGGLVSALTGSAGQAAGSGGDVAGGSGELNPLAGSEAFTSSELPDLSVSPLDGSSELPDLSVSPLQGSAVLPGSSGILTGSEGLLDGSAAFTSSDLRPLTGSQGMGSEGMGSTEMSPLSTELNFLGGSAALPPLSSNFPDGSTEGIGGSAELVGEGIAGSLTNGSAGDVTGPLGGSISDGGSLAPIVGSVADCGICEAVSGSITGTSGSLSDPESGLLGSLTGNGGSTGGSAEVLTGSFGDLTDVNGSLTSLTGSLENGSLMSTASTNTGSTVGQGASLESLASLGESGAGSLLPVLALSASAGAAALAAGVANGTIMLPPLPFPLPMQIAGLPVLPDNGRG